MVGLQPLKETAMKSVRTMYCAFLATGLLLSYADSASAIRILMHGREPVPAFRDDLFTFQHLEQVFGADNVDYMAGVDAPADGSAANGYDVLYLSSTMASSVLRDKYEDSTVGIVLGENALSNDDTAGNFMLVEASGNSDMTLDRRKINIVNSSHPLAAGLSGEVTVFDSEPSEVSMGYWWQYGRGNLASGVTLIADAVVDPVPAEPQRAIFAAEVGAQLLGDGTAGKPATAAGRRVFFFLSDYGSADLTPEGFALFDAAIEWAAEDPPMGIPGDYNADGKVDAADYVVWRENPAAFGGDPDGYNTWRTNFDRTSGVGSSLVAVPEPASCVLVVLTFVGISSLDRRGKWRQVTRH
jgi:hypothetical protein